MELAETGRRPWASAGVESLLTDDSVLFSDEREALQALLYHNSALPFIRLALRVQNWATHYLLQWGKRRISSVTIGQLRGLSAEAAERLTLDERSVQIRSQDFLVL